MRRFVRSLAVIIVVAGATAAVVGAAQNPPAQNYWTGGGGMGQSLTIFAPEAALDGGLDHLPVAVQAELISNFSGYSAIRVLGWDSLEGIYSKLAAGGGSAGGGVALQEYGRLAPTDHFMIGEMARTESGYRLEVSVVRKFNKKTTAAYSGSFTFAELESRMGIRRASLELLKKMGVSLTAVAMMELAAAAPEGVVSAQDAFARGVVAQRRGAEVMALSYYLRAAAYDPAMGVAASRSSALGASISGGGVRDGARDNVAWRRAWMERLAETERYFDNVNKAEPMPYTLFYLSDIRRGAVNDSSETMALSTAGYLYGNSIWTQSLTRALSAVYNGLDATGQRHAWGLGDWPGQSVSGLNAFAERSDTFSVVFELVNDRGEVIGKRAIQTKGVWKLARESTSGRPYSVSLEHARGPLNFPNVSLSDVTDGLALRAVSVNGVDAEAAAKSGLLQVRAVTAAEVYANDRFSCSYGEIRGFNKNDTAANFVIPGSIWGEPVTSIKSGAFGGYGLRGVTVPSGVTAIGEGAFSFGGDTAAAGASVSITLGANVSMARDAVKFSEYRDTVEITARYDDGRGAKSQHDRMTKKVLYVDDSFQAYYAKGGMRAGTYHFSSGGSGWVYGDRESVEKSGRRRGVGIVLGVIAVCGLVALVAVAFSPSGGGGE